MARSRLSPMTVLIGVLAVAAYQNRVRLLDMLDSRGAKGVVAQSQAHGRLGGEQRAPSTGLGRQLATQIVRKPLS